MTQEQKLIAKSDELMYTQNLSLFPHHLFYETYDAMLHEVNPFWRTLELFMWLEDKKGIMYKIYDRKKITEWERNHLKLWWEQISSDEVLKPISDKIFTKFFELVEKGEIQYEEKPPLSKEQLDKIMETGIFEVDDNDGLPF